MADTGNLYREIGALKAAASERTEYYARIIREQAKRIAELEADLEYYKSGFHSERGVHERVAAILGTDDAPWMLAQRAIERIAELEAEVKTQKEYVLLISNIINLSPKDRWLTALDEAREQLRLEGKL